jgi:hypothetical protein
MASLALASVWSAYPRAGFDLNMSLQTRGLNGKGRMSRKVRQTIEIVRKISAQGLFLCDQPGSGTQIPVVRACGDSIRRLYHLVHSMRQDFCYMMPH